MCRKPQSRSLQICLPTVAYLVDKTIILCGILEPYKVVRPTVPSQLQKPFQHY